jgi:type IV secretory pathway VirD2 relaxase
MADTEDEFRVRLGRIGNRRGRKAIGYVRRVGRIAKNVGVDRPSRASDFTGSRIGRGYAQGTVSANRSPAGQRRVVIKTRIVRIKAGDVSAVRAHLKYVQRDGVTREGTPGELYDESHDRTDGKAFAERGKGDRHQFRFIVAAEDSAVLGDLKPFVRDLMRQMETDLGTKLDWVAADHFNTGHPHSHIVVRGKDDRGRDLVIARDYVAYGMRARASELITRELGPESELDQLRKLGQEVSAERFTRLDRGILRDASDGILALAAKPVRDPRRHSLRMGRLRVLERMGLVEETAAGTWRVAADLEPTLRRMGERGDIIKTMHRELEAAGLERAAVDHAIFDPEQGSRLIGRIVGEGFSDELSERRYVILDGIDGRTHYAEIGALAANDELPARNTIVELRSRAAEPREVDRTIAKVAAGHGVYDDQLHRQFDPQASGEYRGSHVRRLEAMRRDGLVTRLDDGRWRIGADYLDRAHRFETIHRARNPVRVAVLSQQRLEDLPRAVGATWLDRQLVAKVPETLGPSGMGTEVQAALRSRRQWLIEQGLAREEAGQMRYARDLLRTLEVRELKLAAAEITKRTGLEHFDVRAGEKVTGVYRRMLTLNSGRFAVVERSRDFALVPWRPVLERARGQLVTGNVGGEGISWSIGLKQGMGR